MKNDVQKGQRVLNHPVYQPAIYIKQAATVLVLISFVIFFIQNKILHKNYEVVHNWCLLNMY